MGGFRYLADALAAGPVTLGVRLAVAVLFAAAGIYKLRHPLVAATSAVNFRVVRRPRRVAGLAIGGAETVTAMALVIPLPTVAVAGCVLAAVFALAFAFVIARALRSGERFPCHCLPGSDDDMSAVTLWRALALATGAAIGVLGPLGRRSVFPAHDLLPGAGIALAVIGMPIAVHAASTVWRRYRSFIADVDWEWVIASREGRVAAPVRRSHVD